MLQPRWNLTPLFLAGMLAASVGGTLPAQPKTPTKCFPAEQGQICYSHIPTGWAWNPAWSKHLGIPAIFYRRGDTASSQPMITVDVRNHFPWINIPRTVSDVMSSTKKQFPNAIMTTADFKDPQYQALTISSEKYWEIMAWRDLGRVVVMATLECRTAAPCAPFTANFHSFVASLSYCVSSESATYKKFNAGFIYGKRWMILFGNMPWINDTDLANSLGVSEIYYPASWDPRHVSPNINVTFRKKTPGDTLAAEMARDVAGIRKQDPSASVSPGKELVWKGGKAPVQIFKYPVGGKSAWNTGWDMTAYSDGGTVIFFTTLHCHTKVECTTYLPVFQKFVPTLKFEAGIHLITHNQSR